MYRTARTLLLLLGITEAQIAVAKCGSVDYTWGADGLAKAHDYVITMLLYVVYLCNAIAGIIVVIGSLQIYIKMNTGEEGIKKEILMICMACLFLISASIVMPAFFGYKL